MSEVIEIERHTFAAMLKSAGGNLKKMSAPRALSNRLSVEEWADIIRADIRRSVESIVAAGHHLREAKKQVEHGEWQPLLDRIGISGPTARKFMAIAEHPVISDRSHVNVLPPSWGTLYELTLVPDDVLNKGIADGRITPNITRKQVEALHRNPPRPRRKCLKRVPNGILTSWEDVNKFRDVVTHNAQVQARQYELGLRAQLRAEDFHHQLGAHAYHERVAQYDERFERDCERLLSVSVMIRVSPAAFEELERYIALHGGGMNPREVMEHAIEVLCQSLGELRGLREAEMEAEQREKYKAAMAEKRAREAREPQAKEASA
jgi:predicted nucleic acid-binding protein